MTTQAYLNRVSAAVPPNDVHRFFLGFASSQLVDDPRRQAIFNRMVLYQLAWRPSGARLVQRAVGLFPGLLPIGARISGKSGGLRQCSPNQSPSP